MEPNDDMIIVIVEEPDDEIKNEKKVENPAIEIKDEVLDVNDNDYMESIMEKIERHGEYINLNFIKVEPELEDDYLEEYINLINDQGTTSDNSGEDVEYILEEDSDSDEYLNDKVKRRGKCKKYTESFSDTDESFEQTVKRRGKRRVGTESYVNKLRRENPDDIKDKKLINLLVQHMTTFKAPAPPRDFYIMNGINFECVKCGYIAESIPAASRHYQEKHGPRYLICLACGVDFRSTTNLYKHEKRCKAPDAVYVLKARAIYLGSKGKRRPFLDKQPPKDHSNIEKYADRERPVFPCPLCPAVYSAKHTLASHLNHHKGVRPYRCTVCPAAYVTPAGLHRHSKKHSSAQFMCDHCGRCFKDKTPLIAHLDTHLPQRKYGCTECEKRFAQKHALILHINRVHRKLPPPFPCEICPFRFSRMSLLKDHMRNAHDMLLMSRKMFFKTLPTLTESEVQKAKVIMKTELNNLIPIDTELNSVVAKKQQPKPKLKMAKPGSKTVNENLILTSDKKENTEDGCKSKEKKSEIVDEVNKDFMYYVIMNGEFVEMDSDTFKTYVKQSGLKVLPKDQND